jgi:hypothetical protein
MARNGIAVYNRKLTDAETKSFEMALLVDSPKDMMEVAQPVISKLKRYAASYVEMAESDPKDFQQTVYEFLKKTAPGYPPSIGDFEAFVDVVVSGLKKLTSSLKVQATDVGDEPPKGWTPGDVNVTFTPFCQTVRKVLGTAVSGITGTKQQEWLFVYVDKLVAKQLTQLGRELKSAGIPGNPRFNSMVLSESAKYQGLCCLRFKIY